MKVSLRWLEEYVAVDVPLESLADRLDMTGTKVEGVHRPGEPIAGVVVAEVLGIEAHPNADNLTLVDVRAGGDTAPRVVCGARNFGVGDKVALATVGARVAGTKIEERRIRGRASQGMLCSAAELGMGRDHSGILVLPPDAKLGADVSSLLDLDDTIIELELTPNRPDCMSMVGVAREVAALLGNELEMPSDDLVTSDAPAPISVDVEDPYDCPRYLARYIEGIVVGPSPLWLAARLLRAGVRPVSNVVDATNYVMLEMGQPLHAFDAARVHEGRIAVRRAVPGERLTTLDGAQRLLHSEDLLIADPHGALAIAGVMGGAGSEVTTSTGDVVLESAYFRPASVGFTSRRHLLRTEASARFERGTDPNGVAAAARRGAQLIAALAGGKVSDEVVDAYPAPIRPQRLRLRPESTNALLGVELGVDEQSEHLESLGMRVDRLEHALEVEVPTFRPDLTREIDLVEEVARLAGYDRLPTSLPPGRSGALEPLQRVERRLRRILAGLGLHEAWTTSFGSPRELDALGLLATDPARALVELENPTSEDQPALRSTLLPGLLGGAARNVAHRADGVALFEIARVYRPSGGQLPDEPLLLAGVFCGHRSPRWWGRPPSAWDLFAVKGVLETAFRGLRLPAARFAPVSEPPWHPTRAAAIVLEDSALGRLGDLHPDVCERFAVPEGTVCFEIALAPLFAALPARPQVAALPRFPPIHIDLAIVVDDAAPAGDVVAVLRDAGGPEVASVRLFDVYRGDQVASGKKSLAYSLELRSSEGTLTDEDAVRVRDRLVGALKERLGAELRS